MTPRMPLIWKHWYNIEWIKWLVCWGRVVKCHEIGSGVDFTSRYHFSSTTNGFYQKWQDGRFLDGGTETDRSWSYMPISKYGWLPFSILVGEWIVTKCKCQIGKISMIRKIQWLESKIEKSIKMRWWISGMATSEAAFKNVCVWNDIRRISFKNEGSRGSG